MNPPSMIRIWLAILLQAIVLGSANAQIPTVDVTKGPLFSAATRVIPNMILDLSVEFPTVGRAYASTTFDPTRTYLGYWDNRACYKYTGNLASGYFQRSGAATTNGSTLGVCDGSSFSGNMLNWAASSAIDMLRLAITGGDRVVDSATQTVLQRAFLSNGTGVSPDYYGNGTYFPMRTINANVNKFTPYTDGTIYIFNCENKIYFGTSSTKQSCGNPGNNGNRGQFLARVEVCTAAEGPIRTGSSGDGLCTLYPSGNYKPTGTAQKYADSMRFAAFGYLNNGTAGKYSAVLRAPMKYVGPTAYDATLNQIVNPAPEWDGTTGVFVQNPLADATGNSGVVNYLNKFGRTSSSPGSYKGYDPISHLYYESLRYLQGKQPTISLSGISASEQDGFALPTWNDPITQSCQKNYVVVIGDVNTWYDKYVPGNTFSNISGPSTTDQRRAAGSGDPDAMYWTRLVGGFETNAGIGYTDSQGRNQSTSSNPNPNVASVSLANLDQQTTGAGGASYYIAGLAYWANTQPIRTDYPNIRAQTFSVDVNEGGDGTIRGWQRGRQLYLAAKYGGFVDKNGDGNPFITTDNANPPNTLYNSTAEWASGVDDDGYPLPSNYFLGGKPETMISALRNIFQKTAQNSGTIASSSISTNKLDAGGGFLYVPSFTSTRWAGTVQAVKLTVDLANKTVTPASTATWDAGLLLTGNPATGALPSPAPGARKIFTISNSGVGTVFQWGNLDSTQQSLLNRDFYSNTADTLGSDRVDYLRGVRTKEAANNGPFRTRDSVVGDIINSGPLFVGGKSSGAAQGKGYTAFVNGLTRTPAVYVGTNGGMVHAFDANTGNELFAYVPNMLFGKLPALTSPNYVHLPYADAQLVAGDADLGSGGTPRWRTVLAGGLGGGAQGVFALDITNPESFGTSNVLWEFTDKDDPDMGYVTQTPEIVKIEVTKGNFRWFVAVASGYDNYQPDGNGNTTGNAALFLLPLDKTPGVAWQRDASGNPLNYYKIVIPNLDSTRTKANALMGIGNAGGAAGQVRYFYAGDIQGNLWKIDVTPPTGSNPPLTTATSLALNGKPLFTAVDASNNPQPITIKPQVVVGPAGSRIVVFGTGKFMENADLVASNFKTQTMYGIFDDGKNRVTGRSKLFMRTASAGATAGTLSIPGSPFPYGTDPGEYQGWYFDLPGSATTGERQVTEMTVAANLVFFNTLTPDANPCSSTGGGRSCAVNPLTGTSNGDTCAASTVGILAAPLVVQFGDPSISGRNSAGTATGSTNQIVINTGTNAGAISTQAAPTVTDVYRRLSWREVVNFKEVGNSLKTSP